MNLSWQISFADLSELIQPALFAAAALISAWVLADARRRSFRLYEVALWTLGTLLLPHVMLPLYLLARMFRRRLELTAAGARSAASENAEATASVGQEALAARAEEASAAGLHKAASHEGKLAHAELAPRSEPPPENSSAITGASYASATASSASFPRHRRIVPALYLLFVLACGALYFYSDYTSADAHLARASRALVRGQREQAISAYRAALRRQDDPRTRKLLGIQLAELARWEEAWREFHAAESGGDPDATLPFRIAAALDALNRPAEALPHYHRFLAADACAAAPPDPRCAQAQERISALGAGGRP